MDTNTVHVETELLLDFSGPSIWGPSREQNPGTPAGTGPDWPKEASGLTLSNDIVLRPGKCENETHPIFSREHEKNQSEGGSTCHVGNPRDPPTGQSRRDSALHIIPELCSSSINRSLPSGNFRAFEVSAVEVLDL